MTAIRIESNTPLRQPPEDYCPPHSSRWFTITEGFDTGKKLFYFDHRVGNSNLEATILFVHGNPECSYTYRHIRDRLIKTKAPLRIIAMDHIGFGLSDQADFEMVDMHHAANLMQLIRFLDLTNVTLVVHDWGGPIGIGAFTKEPERVQRLVVMNTTIFPMQQDGYTFRNYPSRLMPWSQLPKLVPDKLWGGVAAKAVSHGEPQGLMRLSLNSLKYLLLHGAGQLKTSSPEYVWAEPLRTLNNARSSKRNVRQTPRWGHGYRYQDPTYGEQNNTVFYRAMQEQIPKAWGPDGNNIPVSGFFGSWCPCGKDSVIQQWQAALPQMNDATFRFEDVGHFIEEYKGKEIADEILRQLT